MSMNEGVLTYIGLAEDNVELALAEAVDLRTHFESVLEALDAATGDLASARYEAQDPIIEVEELLNAIADAVYSNFCLGGKVRDAIEAHLREYLA